MNRRKNAPVVKCRECGGEFTETRRDRLYCKKACKFRAWARLHPRVR